MDAFIQNIDLLQQLSSSLYGSQETIANDCTSIANLLDEKLADLISLRDQADEMASEIRQQYEDSLNEYVYSVSKTTDLSDMQNNLHFLERRVREADYIVRDINSAVEVCRAAVVTIAELTRTFKNESSWTINQGRRFLSKVSNDLRQYVEHSDNK